MLPRDTKQTPTVFLQLDTHTDTLGPFTSTVHTFNTVYRAETWDMHRDSTYFKKHLIFSWSLSALCRLQSPHVSTQTACQWAVSVIIPDTHSASAVYTVCTAAGTGESAMLYRASTWCELAFNILHYSVKVFTEWVSSGNVPQGARHA